jgi:hypothetical protein
MLLTPEQSAGLMTCRDRWAALRTSTTRVDRAAAEEALQQSYRAAGLALPDRIEWCDGPVGIARSWERSRHSVSLGANVKIELVDRQRDRTASGPWRQLASETRSAVFGSLRSSNTEAVSAAISQAVLQGARTARPPIGVRLKRVLSSMGRLKNPLKRWPDFGHSSFGQSALDWLAPFQALHDVCGVRREFESLQGLWQLAEHTGWVLPHQHVCWLAERPSTLSFDISGRLHSAAGPALAYRDGWSAWFWKGIEVPSKFIESPGTITLASIERQPNAVLRRCMIEIMTPSRFLALGGARIAAQDETGVLWRKTWLPGDSWAAVEVVNGSPDPDGTYRHYILQVPPDLGTPRAAVAWTYGMTERDYRRLHLRT